MNFKLLMGTGSSKVLSLPFVFVKLEQITYSNHNWLRTLFPF